MNVGAGAFVSLQWIKWLSCHEMTPVNTTALGPNVLVTDGGQTGSRLQHQGRSIAGIGSWHAGAQLTNRTASWKANRAN